MSSYDEVPAAGRGRALLPALGRLHGHLLWRAHARVLVVTGDVLPSGVTLSAYAVLLALGDGRPRSQQWLADATTTSRTSMVALAADLDAQGLVARVRSAEDRRSYAMTRTPAGTAAARSWAQHVQELEDAVGEPVDAVEREELCSLLLAVAGPDVSDEVPAPLLHSLSFLLTRAHVRTYREFHAGLEPLGLEPRHFGALVALTEVGPVSQADLALRLGTSAASIVEMVDHLEERGLVERRRVPADRRTLALHLLGPAPDLLDQAGVAAASATATVLAHLDADQRERLSVLLRRLVTGERAAREA